MTSILAKIHEGMDVFDKTGGKIGTVEFLKMTDENPDTPQAEQLTSDPGLPVRRTFVDNLMDVFRSEAIPDPLHETMLRTGFLRMDSEGLLSSDRYVLPSQIAEVNGDKVKLSVSKDALIRRN